MPLDIGSPQLIAVAVAVALFELAATVTYVRAVIRGATSPSRMTWVIWAVLAWLTVASSVEAGAGATLTKLVCSAIGLSVIAILSLRHGTGGRSHGDLACLALTVAGIALWSALDDPVVALAIFLAADVAGAFPTLRDTWHDGRKEAAGPWRLGFAGAGLNLLLVDPSAWTAGGAGFAHWGVPVYLAAVNAAMLLLIARRAGSFDTGRTAGARMRRLAAAS